MESISSGLRQLQDDAAWFTRAKELRLLHVTTSADLGAAALKLCAGQEYHADNKSLFFTLEESYLLAADGWYSRGQTLRQQYALKQEALAKEGIVLPPLRAAEKGQRPVTEFIAVLQEISFTVPAPLDGVVLVLAPKRIEPGSPFIDELRALIHSPTLTRVRWIVMERDQATARPLVDELKDKALASTWLRDEGESNKDYAALVGPPDTLFTFSPKPLGWRAAGAMPDVEPPPRVGTPPPLTDEQIIAQGLSPQFVNGGGQVLQRALLGAALALKEGRPADAIRLQTLAADLCGIMGMPKEQVLNVLILGSYYLSSESRGPARKTYEEAGALAAAAQLKDQEAQAHLSLGLLDALEGQHTQAMAHYSSAAEISEASGNYILAIECWRTAGQLAFNLGVPDTALQPWLRGLKLVSTLEPAQTKPTSAAEIARGVASIFRTRGQIHEAGTLEQQAFRYEHGLDPNAPVPQA